MVAERHDILLVARDTWSGLWRRRQYLADEFSRRGRVLFDEAPFSIPRFLARSQVTLSRPTGRIISGAASAPKEVQPGLFVTAPIKFLPNHPAAFRAVNRAAETAHILRALSALKMERPILWINPEYARWLPDVVPHSLVIYDVTDDWPLADLSARERAEITADDRAMLERADIVFTVSNDLYKKKAPYNPNTIFMPNGVDADLYGAAIGGPKPPELEGLPGPLVGYTGSLHEDRIDAGLIEYLSANGNFTQVFVGPDYLGAATRRRLRSLPNCVFISAQPHDRLPAFLNAFDVCCIPHVVSPFTNSLDPIKAYEYLASGKPSVSVNVDGVAPLADHIDIASSREEYLKKIRLALEGKGKSDAKSRIFAARQHSWQRRADEIFSHINSALEKKQR